VKALYLDGRGGLDVRLDGPALRVRRPGRVDGLFPLCRVARIIAVGEVRWQPDALGACLRDHKPVAALDSQGRFVRVLFGASAPRYGLARHLGGLLDVPRFHARYERWLCAAEQAEMWAAGRRLAIACRDFPPDNVWQMVCRDQHRRWRIRVGRCYRYLLGLTAAQIASAFLSVGLPRDPVNWKQQEYRLFSDMVRLERWRQALLLEEQLAHRGGRLQRRELTAAFEGVAIERERRIASWRQRALVEMMGVRPAEEDMAIFEQPDSLHRRLEISQSLARLCHTAYNRAGNCGRIPFGVPESLRTSVRILRDYLKYDRSIHESYGTA
jgi:hypothetical protein